MNTASRPRLPKIEEDRPQQIVIKTVTTNGGSEKKGARPHRRLSAQVQRRTGSVYVSRPEGRRTSFGPFLYGHTGLARMILGSVAQHVVYHAIEPARKIETADAMPDVRVPIW